jgi:mono/diheme cytochrome c family protein
VAPRKLIPAGAVRVALAVAGISALFALTGCGVSTKGDFDRGKQLFTTRCATCHSLRDAGSTAVIGPDLDAAFAQARASGMDPETISGVVKAQVENPRPSNTNPAVSMPADIVTGSELDDVASYLGEVAGNPAIKAPKTPDDPGAPVFAQNGCSGCHTMKAMGASGTVGPDLDKVIPGMTAAEVKESIVDPNKKIATGFPPNVMPDTFGQSISPTQLDQLVQFLLKYANPTGEPSGAATSSTKSSKSAKSGSANKSSK